MGIAEPSTSRTRLFRSRRRERLADELVRQIDEALDGAPSTRPGPQVFVATRIADAVPEGAIRAVLAAFLDAATIDRVAGGLQVGTEDVPRG